MITGVGTDLVEIVRVQKAIGRSAFLEKVYTEKERELIAKRPVRAAGNFAAKEAVAKALGCGFAGIAPREIEVLREASGLPFVVLHGKAKKRAEELGVDRVRISITDTADYAQSCAVCEREEQRLPNQSYPYKKESSACLKGKWEACKENTHFLYPVLSGAKMKEADRKTIEEKGIPSLVLMERAAMAVTECVKKYAVKGSQVGVLCGSGNNGGDGVAVARLLTEAGIQAEILVMEPERCRAAAMETSDKVSYGTPEFVRQLKMAAAFSVKLCGMEHTGEYDIIVDALFGIGLERKITGKYAEVIERINHEKHIVIAADIASGIAADTGEVCGVALYADETVTFGAAKFGHLMYPGKEYTGILTVAEIGFPTQLLWEQREGVYFDEAGVDGVLPERPAYSNKGTFGRVVVVAGSKCMAGAAYFSACAAYRMGAGLVKIVTPECNRETLQTLLPEAMLAVYEETEDFARLAKELADFADALVIGPGLGQSEGTERLLAALREELCSRGAETPFSVWDADGLNFIARQQKKQNCDTEEKRKAFLETYLPEHCIITPHLGELSRLTGKPVEELAKSLLAEAWKLSGNSKLVYVLKDAVTVVSSKKERFFNTTGNNGMATGGSGDALCGVIAALLAAGMEPFLAAAAGVWLHGAAGDRAANELGTVSVTVKDILKALGSLYEEEK